MWKMKIKVLSLITVLFNVEGIDKFSLELSFPGATVPLFRVKKSQGHLKPYCPPSLATHACTQTHTYTCTMFSRNKELWTLTPAHLLANVKSNLFLFTKERWFHNILLFHLHFPYSIQHCQPIPFSNFTSLCLHSC